ncbi:unnamed protein product [Prunus armeniaca]|uniref:Pectinesterase n=1 Tax=Prunus armeniaca TaxID=36596 RepID=A0A6J5V8M9_PRUAR|nr:unnamed protein product [Prunus armeniaca]
MADLEDAEVTSKRRIAIIVVSGFFLVSMVVALTVGAGIDKGFHLNPFSDKRGSSIDKSASTKAIKAICQPTDYKQECLSSLTSAAGNTTDQIQLIKIGFQATMKQIYEGTKKSNLLQKLEKDPRTSMALDTCKELMELAVDELRQSFNRVGDIENFSKYKTFIMDLKVWLSASITYQESCLDAFENTTSSTDAGLEMKTLLKTSMRLSSNGLAMVSQIFSALTDLNNPDPSGRRRLLSLDGLPILGHGDLEFPEWYEAGVRKLLTISTAPAPKANKPNAVVAKDGSGSYKTISEALEHVPKYGNETFVIYIKEGVYNESVRVNRSMTNVMMIGDGTNKTRITGNQNFVDGTPTYRTATVAIHGDHFMAMDIGFENSAGPEKHQAVALRVSADEAIFYKCSMDGYQDTLYTHTHRQFYHDCTISGTIDFVFGDAAAIFQNCTFVVRKPLPDQSCIVTAQGRKERRQPSAIVIQNSTITADPDYFPVKNVNKAYLGRPWKEYSRTIIMESYIDDVIQPEGWLPWAGQWGLRTCFYTEFRNTGPAANKARRVTWQGIKQITRRQAAQFTPGKFFRGDEWIKLSGVPYVPGLTTNRQSKNATTNRSVLRGF